MEILSSDIAVKEALALSNALSSFAATIKDSRVDVYVDSTALFHAWNSQSARSHALSDALKSIYPLTAFFASSTFLLPTTLPTILLALSPWRIPVCLLAVGTEYKMRLVAQLVTQLISWLFHPTSCVLRLV